MTRLCWMLSFCCILTCCKKSGLDQPIVAQVQNDPLIVTAVLQPVTHAITNNIGGYYITLPSNYKQSNLSYPLLLFIHGAGQFGNGSLDLPLLLNDGPAQLVDEKRFPGIIKSNDQDFSFIILTPQTRTFAGSEDIAACITYAKQKYRVDSSRIYLSGLSSGSEAICNYASEHASEIAAIVPMAGVPVDYATTEKCKRIAQANLAVWAFHCEDDPTIKVSVSRGFISQIASFHSLVLPRLTVWADGGHDAWTRALDPLMKENGLNIYEWMLRFHR